MRPTGKEFYIMNVNDTMHPAQVSILHALLFRPSASFSDLQKASALSSDHFNFHLKQMLDQGVISKNSDGHYTLTQSGKEYANRFDTDERVVERQPKVAVLLHILGKDGKQLFQQRLKQPYYGFWGRPTGKIRWGETIIEGAARELKEETNLEADLAFVGIHHKMDYNKSTGKMLEDKVFFTIKCTNTRGRLLEDFDGGKNAWMTREEVTAREKVFEGIERPLQQEVFEEKKYYYPPDEY
jgi:ADP-ribose pyrophosphatase YjhB (NUDIX family)